MRHTSLATRVVRGTILVALLSAIGLATTAAIVARILWQSEEEKALADTAQGLGAAIEQAAREDGISFEEAAPDALEDSAIVGYRIELWDGGRAATDLAAGDPIGPPPAGQVYYSRAGYLVRAYRLGNGEGEAGGDGLMLLVGAPEEAQQRALRVFAWSLGLSLPVCLVFGVGVGWAVGRRATRPLVEFTRRVGSIRDPREGGGTVRAVPRPRRVGWASAPPAEIEDLEEAFGALLDRLAEMLRREVEFAANASHELRTPLTQIRLYAEAAAKGASDATRASLALQMDEIDRMVRLVDALLVMAHDTEAGRIAGEPVNLADVAREAAARSSGSGPDGQRVSSVSFDLPDELLVSGDENLLGIAVENLLDNARKFASGDRPVRVFAEPGNGRHRLAVETPGARIPADEQVRVFERFHRGPRARAGHAGHGLGLPLARHIARLHGGDVVCASAPDEDARFVLELPGWTARGGGRS